MTREEAIEVIRKNMPSDKSLPVYEALHSLIPELSESEDERILRVISEAVITFFSDYANNFEDEDRDAALAWLEKQKEPHYTKRNALFDKCVENCDPEVMKEVSDKVDEMLGKEQKPKAKAKSPLSPHELYDAKIEGISQGRQDVIDHPEQFGLQKPVEWSREDQKSLNRAINICISDFGEDCETARFLKSLPKRFNLQPKQEWSEEDEDMIQDIIASIDTNIAASEFHEMETWLKSLRPSWKPSEEQMEALEHALISCEEEWAYQDDELRSLLDDLKKL